MTQDQLKELATFHERWCNDPPGVLRDVEIPAQVMDLLPDVIQALKEREGLMANLDYSVNLALATATEKLTAERDAALSDLKEWKRTAEALKESIPAANRLCRELEEIKAERDAALKACSERRDALIPFQCETCNGTHKFTFECPSCLSGEGECTCNKQQPEPCPQCQSDNGCKEIYAKLEHALSTDCGKGYHADSEWKPVLDVLKDIATDDLDRVSGGVKQSAQQALAHAERITAAQ